MQTGKKNGGGDLSKFTSSGYRIKKSRSGFILCVHPMDEESKKYNLLSVNSKGMVQWAKSYGEIYWGFDQNEKGEILVAGHTRESPWSKKL